MGTQNPQNPDQHQGSSCSGTREISKRASHRCNLLLEQFWRAAGAALMQFLLVRGSDGRPQMLQDFVLERKDQLAQGTFEIGYQLTDGRR